MVSHGVESRKFDSPWKPRIGFAGIRGEVIDCATAPFRERMAILPKQTFQKARHNFRFFLRWMLTVEGQAQHFSNSCFRLRPITQVKTKHYMKLMRFQRSVSPKRCRYRG